VCAARNVLAVHIVVFISKVCVDVLVCKLLKVFRSNMWFDAISGRLQLSGGRSKFVSDNRKKSCYEEYRVRHQNSQRGVVTRHNLPGTGNVSAVGTWVRRVRQRKHRCNDIV